MVPRDCTHGCSHRSGLDAGQRTQDIFMLRLLFGLVHDSVPARSRQQSRKNLPGASCRPRLPRTRSRERRRASIGEPGDEVFAPTARMSFATFATNSPDDGQTEGNYAASIFVHAGRRCVITGQALPVCVGLHSPDSRTPREPSFATSEQAEGSEARCR